MRRCYAHAAVVDYVARLQVGEFENLPKDLSLLEVGISQPMQIDLQISCFPRKPALLGTAVPQRLVMWEGRLLSDAHSVPASADQLQRAAQQDGVHCDQQSISSAQISSTDQRADRLMHTALKQASQSTQLESENATKKKKKKGLTFSVAAPEVVGVADALYDRKPEMSISRAQELADAAREARSGRRLSDGPPQTILSHSGDVSPHLLLSASQADETSRVGRHTSCEAHGYYDSDNRDRPQCVSEETELAAQLERQGLSQQREPDNSMQDSGAACEEQWPMLSDIGGKTLASQEAAMMREQLGSLSAEEAQESIKAGLVRTQMDGAVSEEVQDSIKAGLVRTQMDDAVRAAEYDASLQRAVRLRDSRAEAARVKAAENEVVAAAEKESARVKAAEEAAKIAVYQETLRAKAAEEEAARAEAAEDAAKIQAAEYEASLQRAARLRDSRLEAARVKAAEKEAAKSKAIEDALRARDAAEEAAAIRVVEEEAARIRAAEEAIAAPADPVWRMLKLQQGLADWRRVAEAALVIEASKVRCDAHFRQALLSSTLDTLQIESVGWSLYRRVVHRRAFSRMRKYCQQQRVSRIAFTFS